MLVGPIIFNMHITTYTLWFFLRIAETIDVHSGYDLPISFSSWLPGLGGPRAHDFHHSHNKGNYGAFKIWDWAFGTDKPYKEWLAGKKVKTT